METPSAEDIRHHLMLFGQSVDESVRVLTSDPDPAPRLVSAPYLAKCRIRNMLPLSWCTEGTCTEPGQEYYRIAASLDALAGDYGQKYRDLLLAGLREMIHAYHAGTCYSHLGLPEEGYDPILREAISELFACLHEYYDLPALERFVEVVDENAVAGGASVTGYPAECLQPSPGMPASVPGSIPCSGHRRITPASRDYRDNADGR